MSENLDPPDPDPRYFGNGEHTIHVERPIPVVLPWSISSSDEATILDELNAAGFVELEVVCTMDEGAVHLAEVRGDGKIYEIELTASELENAAVDFAEDCAAYPDEPE